jgi:hypothetical protein
MAKDDLDRAGNKVFGDIDPAPGTQDHVPSGGSSADDEESESMRGSSKHDETKHSGSRDIASGGAGTETGGTRNFRQGSGAAGGDVGNRPE